MDVKLKIKGVFEMTIYRVGMEPEKVKKNNLIVNLGLEAIVSLLANYGTDKYISKIAAGTNGVAQTVTDTTITDAFEKNINDYDFPQTGKVSFNWSLENFENNGMEIQEFGLLCEDGSLFARINHNPIDKDSSMRIEGQWSIELTNI